MKRRGYNEPSQMKCGRLFVEFCYWLSSSFWRRSSYYGSSANSWLQCRSQLDNIATSMKTDCVSLPRYQHSSFNYRVIDPMSKPTFEATLSNVLAPSRTIASFGYILSLSHPLLHNGGGRRFSTCQEQSFTLRVSSTNL